MTAPHRQGRPTWPSAVNCYHPDIPLAVPQHIAVSGLQLSVLFVCAYTERKLRQQKPAEFSARIRIMPTSGIRTRHYKFTPLLVKVDNPFVHAKTMHTGAVDLHLHSFLSFGAGWN
jgi:hypothetical protein